MTEHDHPCGQAVTLNTMCLKLEAIEKAIAKMDPKLETLMMQTAKYPSSQEMDESFAEIERHKTYFKIMGVGLASLWGLFVALLIFVLEKFWR